MNTADLVLELHARFVDLGRQLAEAQAREAELRRALELVHEHRPTARTNDCGKCRLCGGYTPSGMLRSCRQCVANAVAVALELPADDTALRERVAKAVAEETERLTKVIAEWRAIVEREHNPSCATLGGEPCDCSTGQAGELRRKAVAEERAACAKLIEGRGHDKAAEAIRKRGEE